MTYKANKATIICRQLIDRFLVIIFFELINQIKANQVFILINDTYLNRDMD
jgi:hypothetical protein